jgi:hypothetical protein
MTLEPKRRPLVQVLSRQSILELNCRNSRILISIYRVQITDHNAHNVLSMRIVSPNTLVLALALQHNRRQGIATNLLNYRSFPEFQIRQPTWAHIAQLVYVSKFGSQK